MRIEAMDSENKTMWQPVASSVRFKSTLASERAAKPVTTVRNIFIALGGSLGILLGGCAPNPVRVPPSQGHITAPATQPDAAGKDIPPPARISTFVPPPKPALVPQTYSVVVNEVPVKELLLALSRDTRQNIDVHPGISGLVSLNAINETLPAILERVSKQVNMRYRVEGNAIIVSPDVAYMKTYRIPYVNMTRDTTSTVNVSGEISAGTSGSAGTTGGGSSGTQVRTVSNNDFWKLLTDNIRSIVLATRAQSQTAEERASRAEALKSAREERLLQAEVVARAGAGATNLFSTAFGSGTAQPTVEGRDDIVVNPVGGTISVLATERQHQLIQQHVDSITSSVQRQVLIEATIVEVKLSNTYQGGIDWSRLAINGGIQLTQSLLTGFGGAGAAVGLTQLGANFFQVRYVNPNTPVGNISSTVKLLEEFGDTKILSSPKLMALNNQTALLKVVDNIVYFEIQASTTQAANAGVITTFNTTPKTISVGVVMGVTPQIAEDGRVSLNVRPTISRILRFRNDPNPQLCDGNRINCIQSPVPEVQVREMESVLQVGSGQTVILGGLMQDDVRFSREQIPGADLAGPAGDLVRFRNENASKTELVIFLRPTVVTNPSLDSDELRMFRRYLPQPEPTPAPRAATP